MDTDRKAAADPPERMRTPGGARGRSQAVVASLVLAAQLASAAHLVLVRHEECPLDGELIMATKLTRTGSAKSAPGAQR